MLRRLVSITAVLASLACIAIAYIQAIALQQVFPLDTQASLTLNSEPQDRDAFLKQVKEFGESHDLVILLGVPDQQDYLHGRTLYSLGAHQPPTSTKLELLDPSMFGTLHGASDVGDARLSGYYMLRGSDSAISTFQSWLKSAGFAVTPSELTPFRLAISQLFLGGLLASVLAALTLGAITAMAWYSAKAESRAIRLLTGERRYRIHVRDFLSFSGRLLLRSLTTMAASSAMSLPLFGWRNTRLLLSFALPYLAGWFACVYLAALALSWISSPRTHRVATREPQIVSFQFVSQLLKVGTLSFSLAVLPVLALTASAATEKVRVQSLIAPLRNQLSVTLKYDPRQEDRLELDRRFASMVAEEDAAENVALGAILNRDDPVLQRAGFDAILVVNTRYLAIFKVDTSHFIQVPESDYQSTIYSVGGVLSDSRTSLAENGVTLYRTSEDSGLPARVAGGQEGFMVPRRPLIMVTSELTKSLGSGSILALLTMENITFSDSTSLRANVTAAGVNEFIGGIQRVTDTELQYAQFLNRSAATMLLAAAILIASLLLTSNTSAMIYAIRNSRRIFVLRTSGASWPEIMRRRVITESVMVALLILLVCTIFYANTGTLTPWPLAGAAAYSVFSWLLHLQWARRIVTRVATRSY